MTLERFWKKVDKTDTCWNWTASKSDQGYGYFGLDGKVRKAHRVAWEFENGPLDSTQLLDHTCYNPSCVRVAHLRIVTNKQNMENRKGPHTNSKSGVRGVQWREDMRKWVGQVNHNQTRYHVGSFADLAEAEAAVIAKRNELFTHNNLDRTEEMSAAA